MVTATQQGLFEKESAITVMIYGGNVEMLTFDTDRFDQ